MNKAYRVHPVSDMFPMLSGPELQELANSIKREGLLHPCVLQGDVLLDGHNRHAICTKHDIPFNTVPAPLYIRTDEDAEDWIDKNQLGRRNLSKEEFTLIVGRRYNRKKKAQGFQEAGPGAGKTRGQNDPMFQRTAEVIAAEHGISPATVKRAGKFAEAVEEQREAHPEADEALDRVEGWINNNRMARERDKAKKEGKR